MGYAGKSHPQTSPPQSAQPLGTVLLYCTSILWGKEVQVLLLLTTSLHMVVDGVRCHWKRVIDAYNAVILTQPTSPAGSQAAQGRRHNCAPLTQGIHSPSHTEVGAPSPGRGEQRCTEMFLHPGPRDAYSLRSLVLGSNSNWGVPGSSTGRSSQRLSKASRVYSQP